MEPPRLLIDLLRLSFDGFGFLTVLLWHQRNEALSRRLPLLPVESRLKILAKVGPLDLVQKYNHPDPKIRQKYFHSKGASEYLLLDVCIQSHSRQFAFVKEMTHELPLVIFDKSGVTKPISLNKKKFDKEIKDRVEELRKIIAQQSRVTKYIHRDKFLEALVYYHRWILQPLVELLRIKYMPLAHDYYLVHVSDHLPKNVVKKIEDLYKVTSVKDIGKKINRAITLFNDSL
jgi:hypothetical protein